jgi:hypothetical protein
MKTIFARGATLLLLGVLSAAFGHTLVGCASDGDASDGDDRAQGRTVHPVDDLLPEATAAHPMQSIAKADTPEPGSPAARTAAMLRGASELRDEGAIDGGPEDTFGEVVDVALDAEGRVLVLDARESEVTVFDAEGRSLPSVGRAGRGPGELYQPNALALSASGLLAVADPQGRTSVFAAAEGADAEGGAPYRYRDQVSATPTFNDLCFLGDRLFARGFWAEASTSTLHAVSLDEGRVTGSFGWLYPAERWIVRMAYGDGGLLCTQQAGLILTYSSMLPYLHAYDPEGRPVWTTRLSDLRTRRAEGSTNSSGRDSFTRPPRETGQGRIASLLSVGSQGVVVQVVVQTSQLMGIETSFARDYYYLDARTGEGSYLGRNLLGSGILPAPLLGALRDDVLVTYRNYLYPSVTWHRLGRPGT